jgi:hypothetical protein
MTQPTYTYDEKAIARQARSITRLLIRLFDIDSQLTEKQGELTDLIRERDEILTSLDPMILQSIHTHAKKQLDEGAQSE